jgi:Family of unknown function (DUF6210)
MISKDDLSALKQRWLTSGSFKDEQAFLAARVRLEDVRFVYLDPDGTLTEWIAIVIRRETGVVYGTQCAGVATEQRFIEGYLIPVAGAKYDVDEGNIEVGPFRALFHDQDACKWSWSGRALPSERLALLKNLLETIPYWCCNLDGDDQKHRIRIDEACVEEIAEAWIPVHTPDGPGVLLFQNCD